MLKVLFPWKHNNTKKVLLAMEQVEDKEVPEVTEEPPENLPLLPCHVCHRTFLPQPLKKHIRICEQMLHKKRKPFDSLKQRVEGTDLAPFFQKSYLKKNNPVMSSKKEAGDVYGNNKPSKWKEKHLELMNTIRTAKGVSPDMNSHSSSTTATTPNRKATHLVVSQSSVNERCPSCDRAFGPKAFDRHVEWCREHKSRVHKSPADVQQAKERLEARIKYRVPPLKQPKRLTVREKYSPITQTNPLLHRAGTIVAGKSSTSIGSSSTASMTINRKKHANAIEKEGGQANKELDSRSRFDKSIGDCGEVKELVKGDSTMGKSVTLPSTPLYDPFESAQRQFMELLENDDNVSIKSSPVTPNIHDYIYKQQNLRPHTTTNATPKQKITNSTNKSKKPKVDKVGSDPKRTSVIDPPYNFQDKINSLDEEFELIESLVNNNLINEESDKSNRFFLNLESLRYVGDETSTSTRRKYSDDISFIDPDLINEHDNLSIPENLNSDEYSPTSTTNSEMTVQNFKPLSDSLENIDTIPDPSSLSKLNTKISNKIILPSIKIDNIRPAPDGSSAEVETKENRLNLKTPTMLGQLPRSKSNFKIGSSGDRDKKKKKLTSTNNLSKPPNLHKKEDVKNYFNVQKDQQKQNHLKQETVGLGELKAEELFSVDDEMYEEYKKYEEMYLKEKDGKSSSKKHKKKTADFGIAIEDKGSKICADSAYGSLNRKQPINEPEEPLLTTELGTGEKSTSSPGGRMSKFCHECGNRYPVSAAKFCVECGVKRLVL